MMNDLHLDDHQEEEKLLEPDWKHLTSIFLCGTRDSPSIPSTTTRWSLVSGFRLTRSKEEILPCCYLAYWTGISEDGLR